MTYIRYLTHPQVLIEPETPVSLWGLSAVGRQRVQKFAQSPLLSKTTQIISSVENNALQTALSIADALGISLEVRHAMHENDRSATGYLQPDEFEEVANEFFAYPLASVRGWERAIDAQARTVREVEAVLERNLEGDVLCGTRGRRHIAFLPHAKAPTSRVIYTKRRPVTCQQYICKRPLNCTTRDSNAATILPRGSVTPLLYKAR